MNTTASRDFLRRLESRSAIRVAAAALALLVCAPSANADKSDSTATSNSSDIFAASSGWKKDRIWYTDNKDELPVGQWDDQFKNSFAGVGTAGAGWTTWSFLAKPNAAGWTGTFKSNPYPHKDTSAGGSTAENWTVLTLYKGPIGGYYAVKETASRANAKVKADNPTIAATRITDPWDIAAPSGGAWTLGMEFSEFGAFDSVDSTGSIFANYSVTLNPSSGSPVVYNILSMSLSADGTVSVTSDLNNNDAETTNTLIAGQFNGVLLLDDVIVTPAQAAAALLTHYSAGSGWDLNPNGYTIDTFHPDDPTHTSSVFSLSARAFLDGSTPSVTISTANGSEAIAVIPEPETYLLMLAGLALVGMAARRGR